MRRRQNVILVRCGRLGIPVRCGFRNVLAAMTVFSQTALPPDYRVFLALRELVLPPMAVLLLSVQARRVLLERIFTLLTYFEGGGRKVLDFCADFGYVYASFLHSYGIDLTARRTRLSWKRFCYLLLSLPPDAKLTQIIALRTRRLPAPSAASTEDIAALRRARRFFALRDADDPQRDLAGIFSIFKRQE